jgi:hypothetical protein
MVCDAETASVVVIKPDKEATESDSVGVVGV